MSHPSNNNSQQVECVHEHSMAPIILFLHSNVPHFHTQNKIYEVHRARSMWSYRRGKTSRFYATRKRSRRHYLENEK